MFGIRPRKAAFTLAGLSNALWSTGAAAAVMTPRTRRKGPLAAVPKDLDNSDWDLVQSAQALRSRGAEILYLFGEVIDFDGHAVPDARIDIFQTGPDGRVEAEPKIDEGFRGHGSTVTDTLGHFMFRTILPTALDGCAPHIDARVIRPRGRVLETQIYLVDAPENDRDWHFQSLGPSRQAALSIDPVMRPDGDLEAGFTFVV